VLENLELEISILRKYRHPNIVCLHDVQKTERHFYLILEYCGGGDLQRLIRTRRAGRLTERLTRRLVRDLAAGLRFLWGQELIHRDIKPQNLLLTGPLPLDELHDPAKAAADEEERQKANFPSAQFALKLADFGFARHLQTTSLAETLCGSPLYMAPEILQHQR
jgi:serine/threonine-protein kinase ULK/ATG1